MANNMMTIAEALKEEGAQEARIYSASFLLKKGFGHQFVVEVTGLELSKIQELSDELQQSPEP